MIQLRANGLDFDGSWRFVRLLLARVVEAGFFEGGLLGSRGSCAVVGAAGRGTAAAPHVCFAVGLYYQSGWCVGERGAPA